MTQSNIKKKVLYIENNPNGQSLKFLEKYFNVDIQQINSDDLIGKDSKYIIKLCESYDIIILGGGPQHLTKEELHKYPEINNQIEIIQYISLQCPKSKLLIGICLGCQIIGLAFGHQVIRMDKLCFGYNFLDANSIDHNYIYKSNDMYLQKLDFELLANSFCYHYDQVLLNGNVHEQNLKQNLIQIAKSKTNAPYIIKHTDSNIYGFQFHPESTIECVEYIEKKISSETNLLSKEFQNYNVELVKNFNSKILFHFFNVFFEN